MAQFACAVTKGTVPVKTSSKAIAKPRIAREGTRCHIRFSYSRQRDIVACLDYYLLNPGPVVDAVAGKLSRMIFPVEQPLPTNLKSLRRDVN